MGSMSFAGQLKPKQVVIALGLRRVLYILLISVEGSTLVCE